MFLDYRYFSTGCHSSILDHLASTVGAVTWFIPFHLVAARISTAKISSDGHYLTSFLKSRLKIKKIFGLTLKCPVILIQAFCTKLAWEEYDLQGIYLPWTRINLEFELKWIQCPTIVVTPRDRFHQTTSLFTWKVLWFESSCPGPLGGTQFAGKGISCPSILAPVVQVRGTLLLGVLTWTGNCSHPRKLQTNKNAQLKEVIRHTWTSG